MTGGGNGTGGTVGQVLRDAWRLARPFWTGDERWAARGLLAVVVGLNLALVGMNVLLTFWNRAFFNSLENRDRAAFFDLLLLGQTAADGTWLPGFCVIAALFIATAVFALYLRQLLQIRWRRWLTSRLTGRWLEDRAYYRIALADPGTDNPDQRIAEDARLFVDDSLALGLGLLSSVVTLVSFVAVLWGLSREVDLFGVSFPGWLVVVALVYSAIGTGLAHLIGRSLARINFEKQRREADFRYALIRVRDNAEGVALHRGEADEARALGGRFAVLVANWRELMTATKRLTFFTASFGQAAVVFPYVVAAPAFFAGRIPLGGLTQTASVFSQVQGALSWFVDSYAALTEWRATVARLSGFVAAVERAEARAADGPSLTAAEGVGAPVAAEGLTLRLPDGRALVEDAALRVAPGEALLLTGPSGSGKSTLFRALAGIWPFGEGRVSLPGGARAMFLPQRPYIPLGTLRRAVCYPDAEDAHPDGAVRAALADADLAHLAPRLDDADAWDRRLSGGEQQRLALARALLHRPDWLFLDEATASLDPAAEERLYGLIRERMPGAGVVSIAHRPAVARFHDRALRVEGRRLVEAPAPS